MKIKKITLKRICEDCNGTAFVIERVPWNYTQSIYVGVLRAWGEKVTKFEDCEFSDQFKWNLVKLLLREVEEGPFHELADKIHKVIKKRDKIWEIMEQREMKDLCKSCLAIIKSSGY